jgi:drug/metabolite transporter (DMT)-like permease
MLAVGLSLLASLGFAGAAIFARAGMQGIQPLPSTLVSMVFSFLPALVLALVFALSDIRALPPVAFLWFLGLGAVNFLGGRTQSYEAINRIGAARSSTILGTSAVFATIFAMTITGERPDALVLLGTTGVVAGLAATTGDSFRRGWSGDRRSLLGYMMALVAAASYGGTNVLAKELMQDYGSPLMITALSLLFGIVLLWPMAGRSALAGLRASHGDQTFVVYAALSGLAAAAAVISFYYALQRADVVVVSPIVSSNTLLILLLAKLFISRLENITRQLILGAAVTVAGVVLVGIGSTL